MRRDCTAQFLHYREICRLVWNLGFFGNPNLPNINLATEIEFGNSGTEFGDSEEISVNLGLPT